MTALQFLTDQEIEEIRQAMVTITNGITAEVDTYVDCGEVHVNVNVVGRQEAIDKLTAYVDQRMKQAHRKGNHDL